MIYTAAVLGFTGLCFGSFVNALVWRLKHGRNWVSERSECTHCHHVLTGWDLIPVVSWLWLRGKCRYCKKPIDDSPIVEIAVAILFAGSYLLWPLPLDQWYQLAHFGLWLLFMVILAALFLYDLRWYLLPDKLTYPLIVFGLIDALIRVMLIQHLRGFDVVLELVYGFLSVGGFYGLLYVVSRGRWVGFGDVKLGVFMGLVLGWQAGILAVVLANFIGTLVIIPGLVARKLTRTSRIPFGPFLILGFILAGLFGAGLITWYQVHLIGI
jgi:leader peptidase (prepilin peptidase)/N-methyltransferase